MLNDERCVPGQTTEKLNKHVALETNVYAVDSSITMTCMKYDNAGTGCESM